MKRILLAAALVAAYLPLIAQSDVYSFRKYSWGPDPVVEAPRPEEASAEAIILKDHRHYEFVYSSAGGLDCYRIVHRRVKLQTQDAVDAFNKVYIPLGSVEEILDIRARAISPSGKITELNRDNIKEVENLDNQGNYKTFAVEGLEVNGEMEFYYIVRTSSNYFGREVFQSATPRHDVLIRIVSPSNLVYEGKVYNMDIPLVDSLYEDDEVRTLEMHAAYVPPLKNEEYSAYDAHVGRLEYKLGYNLAVGRKPIFSYAALNEWTTTNFFTLDAKVISGVKKNLAKTIAGIKDPYEAMRRAEDRLKTEINIVQQSLPDDADVNNIFKNKLADESWITRIYAALARHLGIPYQMVYTCDRTEADFDDKFESYNFTREFIIYFPDRKLFLAPTDMFSRMGYIAPNYTATKGLFIRAVEFNGIISGLKEVKRIEPVSADFNRDSLVVNLQFKGDMSGVDFDVRRSLCGLTARYVQPVMAVVRMEGDRQELYDAYLKLFKGDTEISGVKVSGDKQEDLYTRPLVLQCNATSQQLVENAGSKYLLKVGELIGEQAEIYKDTERKLPVAHDHNMQYHRVINVTIPAGYKLVNEKDIDRGFYLKEKDGTESSGFVVTHQADGNTVRIIIDEFYRKMDYTVEEYPQFREVINAAADFNKLVLVLEEN